MSAFKRSSEAPMDFEFTSRPSTGVKPAWAPSDGGFSTPKKRPLTESARAQSPFSSSNVPHFGTNTDIPFIFNTPSKPLASSVTAPARMFGSPSKASQASFTPQALQNPSSPWQPPTNFTPAKTFQPEVTDVDMDATPENSTSTPAPRHPARDNDHHAVKEVDRPVSKNGMRRIFKKRSTRRGSPRRAPIMVHGDDSEEESEEEEEEGSQPQNVTNKTSHHYTLNMPSAIHQKSELPFLLLGYLQFFFNACLVLMFLYLIAQFIITVQRDVEHRISEQSLDVVQEISQCSIHYVNNFCGDRPSPAMIRQCAMWEKCMNQDPSKIGRAKVSAGLVAEVVNSFVDPITWKTLAFSLVSMAFFTLFINTALSLYRGKLAPTAPPPPTPAYTGHSANTPFLGAAHPAYFPPYHHPAYLPAPAPGWGSTWKPEDESGSPTRRRKLEDGVAKVR